MGSSSRYDRDRPVSDQDADEARAFHTLAELVFDTPSLVADRRVLGQVSTLLHSVGTELDNGRAIPRPVRRAVRGLAAALREAMQPRPAPNRGQDPGTRPAAATVRPAP